MTTQEGLLEHLKARDQITAICGDRIYTNHLPEKPTLPAITIRLVRAEHGRNMDGPNGDVRSTMQVESWSDVYRGSLDLAEQVRLAVQGYVGLIGDVLVRSSALEGDVETPEPAPDSSEAYYYAKALIFNMRTMETIPG